MQQSVEQFLYTIYYLKSLEAGNTLYFNASSNNINCLNAHEHSKL